MSKRGNAMINKIFKKREQLENKLKEIDASAEKRKEPIKKELQMVNGWIQDMKRLNPNLEEPAPGSADPKAASEGGDEGAQGRDEGDGAGDGKDDAGKEEEEVEKPPVTKKQSPPKKKPAKKASAKKKAKSPIKRL